MAQIQQTPASGDIAQYMLPGVFLKAVLQQFSGILDIENDNINKLIYFKNGNVVFVESNDREETFGHYLMRKKLIDPKTLTEALQELANQKDLKLGEVLLKRGLINPNSLMEQLNLHQEEKLFNMFAIKKGTYRFIPNMDWPQYVTTFPFRTLNVFFSAVEKHVTLEEIGMHSSLHSHALVQLNYQPSRDLPLPPFATRLLNSLNRETISIDVLANKISVPVGKVITFLFTFHLAEWIGVQQVDRKETISSQKETSSEQSKSPPEKSNAEQVNEESLVEKKEVNPALLQRMQIEHEKISKMNLYQIFGVGPEFTSQQLQVNFFQTIAEYKRYEEHVAGKEILTWIKTAYDVLKDPKLKSIYDYRFGFRKKTANSEVAEKEFFRAIRLLEKGELETAKDLFEDINKKSTDSSYRAYLAWAVFRESPQKNMSDVVKYLEEAFKIYPADPFAHYIAGQVQQYKKDYSKADMHFRAAIQVYPGYSEAVAAQDSMKFEKTKEKRLEHQEKKEKEKNYKPGFFDFSVGGINFGKKE